MQLCWQLSLILKGLYRTAWGEKGSFKGSLETPTVLYPSQNNIKCANALWPIYSQPAFEGQAQVVAPEFSKLTEYT